MVDYTQFKIKEPAPVLLKKSKFKLPIFFQIHKKKILIFLFILFIFFILFSIILNGPKQTSLNGQNILIILEEKYPEYTPFKKIKETPENKIVVCEEPEEPEDQEAQEKIKPIEILEDKEN